MNRSTGGAIVLLATLACIAHLLGPMVVVAQSGESQWLIASPLTIHDWEDIAQPLQDYVANYDLKIVCAEAELPSEVCESSRGPLASKYFMAAINQSQIGPASRVWRMPTSGLLYGAMLILDPVNTKIDPVTQLLHKSRLQRDECARQTTGREASERLRYLRIHVAPVQDISEESKKSFYTQFVDETMGLYMCSEYVAGGEHTVAIFPNRLAQKHFTKFGFRKVLCSEALYRACRNPWFSNRCLMVRTIDGSQCRLN